MSARGQISCLPSRKAAHSVCVSNTNVGIGTTGLSLSAGPTLAHQQAAGRRGGVLHGILTTPNQLCGLLPNPQLPLTEMIPTDPSQSYLRQLRVGKIRDQLRARMVAPCRVRRGHFRFRDGLEV